MQPNARAANGAIGLPPLEIPPDRRLVEMRLLPHLRSVRNVLPDLAVTIADRIVAIPAAMTVGILVAMTVGIAPHAALPPRLDVRNRGIRPTRKRARAAW